MWPLLIIERESNKCREHPIEELGLEMTFSTDDNIFGEIKTIDLKPNGRNIDVTDENKEEYVKYASQQQF